MTEEDKPVDINAQPEDRGDKSVKVQSDHNSALKAILIGLLVTLVAGLAAAGLFIIMTAPNSTQESANQGGGSVKKSEEPALTPQEVIDKIKQTYASKYKLLDVEKNNQPNEGEMSIRESRLAPPYKSEGFDYYTDYDGGSTIYLIVGPTDWTSAEPPRAADTKIRKEVADIYDSYGLTKTGTFGVVESGMTTDVYTGKGLVCTIDSPLAPTSSTSASCGLIKSYKAMAEKVKPFVSALENIDGSAVFTSLEIKNSQTEGYQTATMSHGDTSVMGGAVALFYKKGSGNWTYFHHAQQALACSEYNTTDLVNAFKGQECYLDNGGTSTVQ